METEDTTIINLLSLDEYADNMFSVLENLANNRLKHYQLQAKHVGADYFYCFDSELEKQKIPFVYIYDYRKQNIDSDNLATINKRIWTIGDIALAIVVYSDEVKIIDTRQPVQVSDEGKLIANLFPLISNIDKKLKKLIFSGRILEEKTTDYLSVSPYVKLLEHIDKNILLKKDEIGCSPHILRPLIVKCILIKYLEEQVDEKGFNIFRNNYFSFFLNESKDLATFCDVLKGGKILDLFSELNKKFNGGVFDLSNEEIEEISKSNLKPIANALDGRFELHGQGSFWKLYELKFIPIEFISRLYEKFIISVEGRQKGHGAYYTPPHLARLLVDELIPFDSNIDFENFKLLDPCCGSGIFLVLAYKRLITLWMLQNNKQRAEGEKDIIALKKILSNCIYGVDINSDAISITATSLQIEYTSHFHPKDIDLIQFDNLIFKGNLEAKGFFKWYKSTSLKFDIIVGNPPFNIDKVENIKNAKIGLDDICDEEFFIDEKGRRKVFPNKNPALTIFYQSIERLLKSSGLLFMIMPSSALLYNPTSLKFRKAVFSKWNTKKIFDFTPLKNFLWGNTKVATIGILLQNTASKHEAIEHLVIRSSYLNHKGALRFQIDKYDRFSVPFEKAIADKYYWKTNLLGGGKLHFYVDKYLSDPYTINNYKEDNNWIANVGYQRDASAKKNILNLKSHKVVISENIQNDIISDDIYKTCDFDDVVRVNSKRELYNPPNILLRLNTNYNIPVLLNEKKAYFPKGILGIKGSNRKKMESFINVFKQNKYLYKQLIGIASSKTFVQQSGRYTIDAQDVMNLPLKIDENSNLVAFDNLSEIEKAIWDDTELLALSVNKTTGLLFKNATDFNLEQYSDAFCTVLNYVYEKGEYKFRHKRIVKNEDWVWITLWHTNVDKPVESILNPENEPIYKEILHDDISNNGLKINRIIAYINEPNCISFLKPRALKYWTRSIAYRDAEEIKSLMFKNGY
tara:strand:- start:2356 stop:5268 length:2913 start_codon:yes stop_codon:yes gene_type:complete